MMVSQDYAGLLPEGFDYNTNFVPQLSSLPQTAQPFDLAINPYSQSYPLNGPFPSPMTPTYPVDHRMFSAGSTSSAASAGSAGTLFTPQAPAFNPSETGMTRPIPFTPYRMDFGSFPETPGTSPTLLQEGDAGHYHIPAPAPVAQKVCEIDDISSPNETPLIKRRTRARETCNNCRKEHRACDSKKPRCTRCEIYSKGSCAYDRVPKRRGRKPRPTKPLPDHILGAVIRSNPQLEYAIVQELRNGVQPGTEGDDATKNCDYIEQDANRPALLDAFKASAVYKLVYGDDEEKAEVSASAAIFGAHLDQGYSPQPI
ncbi:hypothetical protein Hte_007825 [Hypoxylon texense]